MMIPIGAYDDDEWPIVCVTHRRFIPCRTNNGCEFSSTPADVEAVRKYQSGEDDHPPCDQCGKPVFWVTPDGSQVCYNCVSDV